MTLPQQAAHVAAEYQSALELGRRMERERFEFIISMYDQVKDDPNARIPTRLALAIEAARNPDPNARIRVPPIVMYDGKTYEAPACGNIGRTPWSETLQAGA